MKLAHNNLFDAGTITEVGSEIATLPVTNLQNVHISTKWHTEAGGSPVANNSHLVIDMGSSVAIGLVAFLGGNLTASATIEVQASDANTDGDPGELLDTGAVAAGVDVNYGNIYYLLSAEITARYWRITISDSGLADNIQIGRCFMGPVWTPSRGVPFGWGTAYQDLSIRSKSRGGQTFIDVGARPRLANFRLNFMGEDEMYNNAFEISRANGLNKDVLYIPDHTNSHVSKQAVFGLITQAMPIINPQSGIYSQLYQVEERL